MLRILIHQMYRIFFLGFLSLFFSNSAFAYGVREMSCATAYQKAVADNTPVSAQSCKSACEPLGENLRKNAGLEDKYQWCLSHSQTVDTSNAKSDCQAKITELVACKSACKEEYDSCLNTCRPIPDTVERTEAFRRCDANFRGKPLTTAKAEPTDPTDKDKTPDEPKEDTENAEEQTPVDPTNPANTGDTNTVAQLPALEGLGTSNYGDTSLSNDASAIDFSKGPTPDRGGFQKAAAGVKSTSDSQGFVGLGHSNFNGELPTGELKGIDPSKTNGGGNGGGNSGGGSPPMNSMAAGGGNGGGNPNAKRPGGGGGNYRNGAADYLSRHSPFSFQSGGNPSAPGASKRAVATSTKKNFGPRYKQKENDGTDALHRLFGNGTTPASYRRNPYAGSGACKDTVFCNMETFYNKIERLPNHDINPDSY